MAVREMREQGAERVDHASWDAALRKIHLPGSDADTLPMYWTSGLVSDLRLASLRRHVQFISKSGRGLFALFIELGLLLRPPFRC